MSFNNLNLDAPILKALQNQGYTSPTPIQTQAIPLILEGKDVLGCARTGTGKTAAFAIPILQLLSKNTAPKQGIRSLILTPTRELAVQIAESFDSYGAGGKLRYTTVFGGVSQNAQTNAIRRGVDVVIATPGRLMDLIQQGHIRLNTIEIFVLDEADRMLDMGFISDIRKIVPMLPQKRQTLFFSATMPPEIQKLANTILRNAVKIEANPVSSTADKVEQSVFMVEKNDKRDLLRHIIEEGNIANLLVFTRTKHGADRVARDLNHAGIFAEAIHGNKSQNARQRALNNFKDKKTRVLVATDIAARGIDVSKLSHVVNFELPNVPETYVHRIGRTGRAGEAGVAISFCDREERSFLKDINKLIKDPIPVLETPRFVRKPSVKSEHVRPESPVIQNRSGREGNSGRTHQAGRSGNSRNSGNGSSRGRSYGNSGFSGNRRETSETASSSSTAAARPAGSTYGSRGTNSRRFGNPTLRED